MFNVISMIGLGYIGLPTATLVAEFAKRAIDPEVGKTVTEAISRALSLASKTDVICVTGSLFVVAEALDYFSVG